MAHKCTSPGCAFYLPDSYPLGKCPWHVAPGSGPVKIAAAIAIAAAGLGGGTIDCGARRGPYKPGPIVRQVSSPEYAFTNKSRIVAILRLWNFVEESRSFRLDALKKLAEWMNLWINGPTKA